MSHSYYTHLSLDERIIIDNRFNNKESLGNIAKSLGRSRATIWRELHRNGRLPYARTTRVNKPATDARHLRGSISAVPVKLAKERYYKRRKYFAVASKLVYGARNAERKAKRRVKEQLLILEQEENEELLEFVITTLDSGWSPEQIAGRVELEGYYNIISAKSIYKFIYKHKELGLKSYLPRHGKKYRKKNDIAFNSTKNRYSIDERPEIVDKVIRIGDLEGDTIVGKDKRDRLLPHVDRLSGLMSLSLVLNFNADKIAKQTDQDIKRMFGEGKVRTATYDNGIEFSSWKKLEKVMKRKSKNFKVYFAHPYHSWEWGRSENVNGLIRRFLPKGTDFKELTSDDILEIESLINNRPRKRLGWLTPAEAHKMFVSLEGLI